MAWIFQFKIFQRTNKERLMVHCLMGMEFLCFLNVFEKLPAFDRFAAELHRAFWGDVRRLVMKSLNFVFRMVIM